MGIREFEELIKNEICQIVIQIIKDNMTLNIQSRSRSGAEISNFFEEKFVEYTSNSRILTNSESSPTGATKNPWDAKTTFVMNDLKETVWIDFKAIKTSGLDSNPDIGTPNKIIQFIAEGNFYLL